MTCSAGDVGWLRGLDSNLRLVHQLVVKRAYGSADIAVEVATRALAGVAEEGERQGVGGAGEAGHLLLQLFKRALREGLAGGDDGGGGGNAGPAPTPRNAAPASCAEVG